MATKDYTLTRALATRLIEKFGGAGNLVTRTSSGPAFDPTVAEALQPVTAAIVDYTARERAGTAIQEGDRRALVTAPSGVTIPTTDTVLRMGSTDYQIMEVGVIQPAGPSGVVVVFDLRVRS